MKKTLTPDEKLELIVTAAHRVLSTFEGPRQEALYCRNDLRDVLALVDPTGIYVNPNQSRTVALPGASALRLISSRDASTHE
jgi:hypothetical protein